MLVQLHLSNFEQSLSRSRRWEEEDPTNEVGTANVVAFHQGVAPPSPSYNT